MTPGAGAMSSLTSMAPATAAATKSETAVTLASSVRSLVNASTNMMASPAATSSSRGDTPISALIAAPRRGSAPPWQNCLRTREPSLELVEVDQTSLTGSESLEVPNGEVVHEQIHGRIHLIEEELRIEPDPKHHHDEWKKRNHLAAIEVGERLVFRVDHLAPEDAKHGVQHVHRSER